MREYLELTADIRRVQGTYEIVCPEMGLKLTSKDQGMGIQVMQRWARSILDNVVCQDNVNS